MYKYEFERVSSGISGWGLMSGNRYGTENYQELIRARAEEGWRYVGFIPAVQRGTGHIEEMDLVFEKEEL
ncbi:MAG TPA: DUF4177 domain-containing protein [Candidatus Lachnoclostridium pullistercoris]|uniref:DUF4177 domain-containing protein n=1 Tax=Candidatus Lachnoclostridium pullistercoris TaxID=2838632 RepID=A0A9D2T7K9_9FIRM|nr:DUF4177 domain-containing protein [Candidatus Lachnoclostridium pullistercoris]